MAMFILFTIPIIPKKRRLVNRFFKFWIPFVDKLCVFFFDFWIFSCMSVDIVDNAVYNHDDLVSTLQKNDDFFERFRQSPTGYI